MNYIVIPDKFRLNLQIDSEDFFKELFCNENIIKINWEGSIKPALSNFKTSPNELGEIEVFSVDLKNRENMYDIARFVFRKVKYPCLIEFCVNQATSICVCCFHDGKRDSEKNILHSVFFSHWLHQDILSYDAQKLINRINDLLIENNNANKTYDGISSLISMYSITDNISRAHVDRLIYDMVGKKSPKEKKEIRKYCSEYKFYPTKYGNRFNAVKSNTFKYVLDIEEVWYSLMKYPETRKVIEINRIKNLEELIYRYEINVGW